MTDKGSKPNAPQKKSKGQATYNRVIEAAFRCIGRDGVHATTFQSIADEAKVSQPLVVRYIGSRDELFPKVIHYYLSLARERTLKATLGEQNPLKASERLAAYVRISAEIFRSSREMQQFYGAVYSLSSTDPRIRAINKEIKRVAVERIKDILVAGAQSGEFDVVSPELSARIVHNAVTGLLLNQHLEAPEDFERLSNQLAQILLRSFMKIPVPPS